MLHCTNIRRIIAGNQNDTVPSRSSISSIHMAVHAIYNGEGSKSNTIPGMHVKFFSSEDTSTGPNTQTTVCTEASST